MEALKNYCIIVLVAGGAISYIWYLLCTFVLFKVTCKVIDDEVEFAEKNLLEKYNIKQNI